jgi:hypothetical protein
MKNIWKRSGRSLLGTLSRDFLAETEKNHEKTCDNRVSQPKFEANTFRIQV